MKRRQHKKEQSERSQENQENMVARKPKKPITILMNISKHFVKDVHFNIVSNSKALETT